MTISLVERAMIIWSRVAATTADVTNPSGDHLNFEVAASGMASGGTVIVTIQSGGVHDTAGNANVMQVASENVGTWHNVANPCDVNGDDGVTPLDVLIIIGWINAHPGDSSLPAPPIAPPIDYYDVSSDGLCTAVDVLLVLNYLDVDPAAIGAEGEHGDQTWAVYPRRYCNRYPSRLGALAPGHRWDD